MVVGDEWQVCEGIKGGLSWFYWLNGFELLGCCAMDVSIEPQSSPLPVCPLVVPHWLMALSCCDAYEYARCPCALRSWFCSWKTTGSQNQAVRGCLDHLHSLGDTSSQFQDVVFGGVH